MIPVVVRIRPRRPSAPPSYWGVPRVSSPDALFALMDSLDEHLPRCTPERAHRLLLSAIRRVEADTRAPQTAPIAHVGRDSLNGFARECLTLFQAWVHRNASTLAARNREYDITDEAHKLLGTLQRRIDHGKW